MPPNKRKKNKQKKKSNGGGGGSAAAAASSNDKPANLNHQVLEALTRLADTLAHLDEASYPDSDSDVNGNVKEEISEKNSAAEEDLVEGAAAITLDEGAEAAQDEAAAQKIDEQTATAASTTASDASTPTAIPTTTSTLTPLPALPLSHWRTLPLPVSSAYKILNDGADYIHATSTKYTLVGKVDSTEGGNLAVELRRGAELIGTGTFLLFSESCGSSRSLRHYVKKSSRALLASVISLVKSFDDGLAQGKANDGNNLGAQKTGAVWSACDNLTKRLPRGNRAAMRRELMVWVRDCNESIEEFEEVLELGPCDDDGEAEEDMMDEEQYTEKEIKVAKSSVNVMKCSKNLLALVLKACECVGEHADKLLQVEEEEEEEEEEGQTSEIKEAATAEQSNGENSESSQQKPKQMHGETEDDKRRKEMLQWISNLHEMARTVGEGVTNCGILMYPPLDNAKNEEELQKWQAKKPIKTQASEEESVSIPTLGSTTLGLQLEKQLHALLECIMNVHDATLPISGEGIQDSLSKEVVEGAERLAKALKVRCRDVEEAVSAWDPNICSSEK